MNPVTNSFVLHRGSRCSRYRQWVCENLLLVRGALRGGVLGGEPPRSRSIPSLAPIRPPRHIACWSQALTFSGTPCRATMIPIYNVRDDLLMLDVVRVCVRPVSPVMTPPELSSVSQTPQNEAVPPPPCKPCHQPLRRWYSPMSPQNLESKNSLGIFRISNLGIGCNGSKKKKSSAQN